MLKKSVIGLMLFAGLVSGSELKCDSGKCETKEKVSFMGYKLYEINYCLTGQEEKVKLVYDIEVSREKNINKMVDKFNENNKVDPSDKAKLESWSSKTVDAGKGSTYEVIASSEKSELKINGKSVLSFLDKGDFGKKFLKIWTGKNPIDDDLKERIEKARKTLAFNS